MDTSSVVPKWERISERIVRPNRYRSFIKLRARVPNGAVGDFYIIRGGRIVCALVLTRDRNVVLTEQYRPGPDRILAELPGGGVEKGESPRRAIVREVLEETGYRGRVRFITASPDSAWSTAVRYHFVITHAVQVADPRYDRFEHGRAVTMALPSFRRYIRAGIPTDVETAFLGLDHLRLL